MKIITAATYASDVLPWWDKAVNDIQVARFLSTVNSCEVPEYKSDWDGVLVMDGAKRGLLKFTIDRSSGHTCYVSCWVLPGPGKQLIAGRLMHYADRLAKQYGMRFIEWAVHETNEDSMTISRRCGESVAYRRDTAWDRYLGRWVAQVTFRRVVK